MPITTTYYDKAKHQLKEKFHISETGQKNGEYISYYDTKGIEIICTYKNDILEGEMRTYHRNGQLASCVTYVKGKKQGKEIKYQDNGILTETAYYKDGLAFGEKINYDQYGNKYKVTTYLKGKKDGAEIYYHTDKSILAVAFYSDDKNVGSSTFKKGTLFDKDLETIIQKSQSPVIQKSSNSR